MLLLILLILHIEPLEKITLGGDAIGYVQLAQNLVDQNSYRFIDGSDTAFRMPGYPLLLAGSYFLSQGWIFIWTLQIILDLVSIWLVYKITYLITKKQSLSCIAALLMMGNPLLIVSSISLLPETITISLGTLGLFILLKNPISLKSATLLSIFFGVCIYLKPTYFVIAIVFFAVLAIFIYKQTNSLLSGVRFLLVTIPVLFLMLLPWVARNLIVMNSFIPLTTSNGVNFYGGNNPDSDGGYVSNEPYVLAGMNEVDSDRIFSTRGVDWIKTNLIEFFKAPPPESG